jgi:hypothetical protein
VLGTARGRWPQSAAPTRSSTARARRRHGWHQADRQRHRARLLGLCATRVGCSRDGASVLQEVLDQFGRYHSHRAVILADLAAAYAGQLAPERSCTVASEALTIIADRRSTMKLEPVASARAWLEPWPDACFVQELDEQLVAVAATL